jgi:Concanavalin A-like lectin/glucanases superfamily/Right handed beta helix region
MASFSKFFTAFILILSISTKATVYYIDYDNGNDTNTGTSQDSTGAWKTSMPVQQNASNFQAGDQILIKRGSTMYPNGWMLYLTSSGTSTNPIVIGAYGTGDKPIIDGKYDLIANSKTWIDEGNNVWSCSYVSWDPRRVWFNNIEKMSAAGPGDITDLSSSYPWFYNNSKLYVYSTTSPSSAYSSIRILKGANIIRILDSSYIEIKDLDIRGGADGAILLKGAQNIDIHDCNIGTSYHAIRFFASSTQYNQYVNIYDNDISSKFSAVYPDFEYFLIGDGVQLLEGRNNQIYNNQFKNWGHTGVNIAATLDTQAGTYDNDVYNNYFTAGNISYGRAFECHGVEDKCTGNDIFNNTIYDMPVRSQLGGNDNYVYYNIFDTRRNNTYKGWGVGQAISVLTQGESGTRESNNLYIYNNLFMNSAEVALEMNSFSGTENSVYKTGIEVKNNIFYNCGINPYSSSMTNIALSFDDCANQGYYTNNIIEKNIFYNDSSTNVISYRNYANMSVAAFETYSGTDSNTFSNNSANAPLLNSDFSIQKSSPAIAVSSNGVGMGLDFDAISNNLPSDSWTDIGAIEFKAAYGTAGMWAFDGNANDSCGSNNGTLSGNADTDSAGIINNVLSLDGINSYTDLGNDSSLQVQDNDISISVWVKMQSTTDTYQAIITKGATAPTKAGYALLYEASTGKLRFSISNGTTRKYPQTVNSVATVILDGNWHHVAVTVDRGENVNFYLDGEVQAAKSNDISSFENDSIDGTANAYIGKWFTSYFKGQIDELRMYQTVIPENYIKLLYSSGKSNLD